MLHAKNVPGQFWAEAMKTETFIINRIPHKGYVFFHLLKNYGARHLQLIIFEFSDVYAMFLYLIIYVAKWTKKMLSAFL